MLVQHLRTFLLAYFFRISFLHSYKSTDDILITFGAVQPKVLCTPTEEEHHSIMLKLTKIYDKLDNFTTVRHLTVASISLLFKQRSWITLELLKFIVKVYVTMSKIIS